MLSLFRARLPIDREELEFQLATFKWLQREFGDVADAPLVLPTAEFFPSIGPGVPATAPQMFDDVRRAARMEDWPCALELGTSDRPVEAGNAHLLRHEGPSAPCGTFRIEDGAEGRRAIITYNPGMERDQVGLVATFAHELGHYLMATGQGTPPGAWDLHELHTDLAAVYLGFGIFMANAARDFRQFQSAGEMGWASRSQGYLSEGALTTALAIFQRLAGRDPLDAAPYLKDYLRTDLNAAARALARMHPDMTAAVDSVDLAEFGSE